MQKETIKKAISNLEYAINYVVDERIKKESFDKTYFAIVTAINDGKYEVLLNNKKYIVPLISWRQPQVKDVVLFIAPCGNFNKAFIQ